MEQRYIVLIGVLEVLHIYANVFLRRMGFFVVLTYGCNIGELLIAGEQLGIWKLDEQGSWVKSWNQRHAR
jgi:hypothetical protein